MSKLEPLARQRAQRNNTSLEGDHPSSTATTKSAALLGRLKGSLRQRNLEHGEQQASENSTVNQGPVQLERPSLADRLRQIQQQRKEGNAGGAATSTTAPTDTVVTNRSDGAKNNILSQIPNPSSSSMKLQTLKLRRQSQLGDTPVKTVAEVTHNKVIVTANEAPIGPETSLNKVDRVRRDFLQFKRLQKSAEVRIRATTAATKEPRTYSKFFPLQSPLSLQPSSLNNETSLCKRRSRELFTLYIPRDRTKRVRLMHNFSKLSPDGIILKAQSAAFENVTKQVAKLSLDRVRRRARKMAKSADSDLAPKVNIREYLKSNNITPTMTVMMLGHTGSGKTALIGKLLVDLNLFRISQINELKIALERARLDKSEYLSWVLDYENKNTVTKGQDSFHQRTFKIKVTSGNSTRSQPQAFKFLDHRGDKSSASLPKFLMDLVSADVAILVVNCATDAFEAGFNINGQILEHCILAKLFGVTKLIIALSQLDTVGWYVGRYMDIKRELAMFLGKLGYHEDDLYWVPCCPMIPGLNDGICDHIDERLCPWFEQSRSRDGKETSSIFEVLRSLYSEISNTTKFGDIMNAIDETNNISDNQDNDIQDRNFLLTIENCSSSESTVTGTVNSGCVQKGTIVTVWPEGSQYVIDRILLNDENKVKVHNGSTEETLVAVVGDHVSLKLKKLDTAVDGDEDMDEGGGKILESELGLQSGDIVAAPDVDVVLTPEKNLALEVMLLNGIYDQPEAILAVDRRFKLCRGCYECNIKIDRVVGEAINVENNDNDNDNDGNTRKVLVEAELVDQSHFRPIPLVQGGSNYTRLNNIILRDHDNRTIGSVRIIL